MLDNSYLSLFRDAREFELTCLYEIASAANSCKTIGEVTAYSLDTIYTRLPFQLAFFLLWETDPPRLILEQPRRIPPALLEALTEFQAPDEIITLLRSADSTTAFSRLAAHVRELLAAYRFTSPLLAPLVAGDALMGLVVLAVDPHPEVQNSWTEPAAHQAFLNEVGRQIGIAQERLAAQRSLRGSHERLVEFLNHVEDGYWELDGQGKINAVNTAALRTLKRPPDQVLGKRVDELSDADPGGLNRLRERLRRDGLVPDFILHVRASDDEIHTIRATIQVAHDAEGNITENRALFRDITQQLHTHNELERRNQELRLLQEFAAGLNDPLNAQTAFEKGLELIVSLTQVQTAAVFLVNSERSEYGIVAHRHVQPVILTRYAHVPLAGEEFSMENDRAQTQGWMQYLIRHPQIQSVHDLRERTQLELSDLPGAEYRSGYFVPLRYADQVYGVLMVGSRQPQPFDAHDTQLLSNLAAQLGLALHNSTIVADLKRQVLEVETVVKTGHLIQSSTELNATLTRVTSEIRHVLGASYVVLHMLHKDKFVYVTASDTRETQRTFEISQYEKRLLVSQEPLAVQDRDAEGVDPEQRAILERLEMRSSFGVRLYTQDRPIGLLFVNQETPRVWQTHEARMISAFAHQIAHALENKRLLDESDRQVRELKALAKVGRLIAVANPPDKALYAVADEVARVLGADYVSFHLREEQNLVLVAESKETGAPRVLPIQPHQHRILEELDPIRVSDYRLDSLHPSQRKFLAEYNLIADLGVPMVSGQRALGILYISMYVPREWSDAEVQLAETFAQQVAGALTTARLLRETQAQVRDLSALVRTANNITRSRSPEHALPNAAEDLRRLLEVDYVGFHLLEGDNFRIVTEHNHPFANTVYPVQSYHRVLLGQFQTVVTHDRTQQPRDPAFVAILEKLGYYADVAVPMISRGRAIGILFANHKKPRRWQKSEVNLIETFAQHIAVVLDLVQLLAEKETRVNDLAQLTELNELTTTLLDEENLVEMALSGLQNFLSADRTTLLIIRDGNMGPLYSSDGVIYPQQPSPVTPSVKAFLNLTRPKIVDPLHPEEFDDSFQERVRFHKAKSFLTLPLVTPLDKIGQLTFMFATDHVFQDHEVRLAQAAANQLTIALANARLVKEQKEQIQKLTQLSEFSLWCGTVRDSSTLEREATRRIRAMLGLRAASIRLVHGDILTIGAGAGYTMPEMRDHPIPIRPRLKRVLEQLKPYPIENLADDPTASMHWRERHLVEGFGSLLMLPMIADDKAVGILTLLRDEPHKWDDHEIQYGQAIANTVALALSNVSQMEAKEHTSDELRATLNSVFSGVFATDVEGFIKSWNRAAQDITGFGEAEMIGKAWHEHGPRQGTALRPDEIVREVIAENSVQFGIAPRYFKHKDGRIIQLRVAAAPLNDVAGNVRGAVCSFWDRTDEQAAERTRVDFINLVGHQLNNKLTAIIWSADQLANEDLSIRTRNRLVNIITATREELKSFNDRFNAFQQEHAAEAIEASQMDIGALLRQKLTEWRITRPDHRFRLSGTPSTVLGDTMRLSVVLDNLLENACKYSPLKSTITVVCHPRNSESLELTIHNRGEPIDPNLLPNLFDRWRRGDSGQPGSGLGLWLVRTKVHEIGGEIEVKSAVRKGTTFSVTLRRAPPSLPSMKTLSD